jgi:hypothetical protein
LERAERSGMFMKSGCHGTFPSSNRVARRMISAR